MKGDGTPVLYHFYPTNSDMRKRLRNNVPSRGNSTRSGFRETWRDMLIASVGTDDSSQFIDMDICQPLARRQRDLSLGRVTRSALTCTMGQVHAWITLCHEEYHDSGEWDLRRHCRA